MSKVKCHVIVCDVKICVVSYHVIFRVLAQRLGNVLKHRTDCFIINTNCATEFWIFFDHCGGSGTLDSFSWAAELGCGDRDPGGHQARRARGTGMETDITQFRSLTARRSVLACDRVDSQCARKEICRRLATPTTTGLAIFMKMTWYFPAHPRMIVNVISCCVLLVISNIKCHVFACDVKGFVVPCHVMFTFQPRHRAIVMKRQSCARRLSRRGSRRGWVSGRSSTQRPRRAAMKVGDHEHCWVHQCS